MVDVATAAVKQEKTIGMILCPSAYYLVLWKGERKKYYRKHEEWDQVDRIATTTSSSSERDEAR